MKGLVLEGGGTKGAYQIGAYKALSLAPYFPSKYDKLLNSPS